jgi:hypothetical protein
MAGAALFLGGVGNQEDLTTLAEMLQDGRQSISVRRALCIAVQRLADAEKATMFAGLTETSATLAVLVRYLSKLPSPRYIARTRRVSLRRLVDELPDSFS